MGHGESSVMALVSIIMPSFNSEKFIENAIESVLSQTLDDWELLISDGGSNDRTVDIIKEYSRQDDRVVYIDNKDDMGPAHARCVGVKQCSGEYVAFLDADDLWLAGKLELQVKFMQEDSIDFSYTSYRSMNESGEREGCVIPMYSSYNFFQALSRRGIGILTVMVKRKLLSNDVIETYGKSHGEDYLWWLLILKQGTVARHLDKDTARYRHVDGALSSHRYRYKHQATVWDSYRNEVGLGFLMSVFCYGSYLLDASLRKIWTMACSRLTTR